MGIGSVDTLASQGFFLRDYFGRIPRLDNGTGLPTPAIIFDDPTFFASRPKFNRHQLCHLWYGARKLQVQPPTGAWLPISIDRIFYSTPPPVGFTQRGPNKLPPCARSFGFPLDYNVSIDIETSADDVGYVRCELGLNNYSSNDSLILTDGEGAYYPFLYYSDLINTEDLIAAYTTTKGDGQIAQGTLRIVGAEQTIWGDPSFPPYGDVNIHILETW